MVRSDQVPGRDRSGGRQRALPKRGRRPFHGRRYADVLSETESGRILCCSRGDREDRKRGLRQLLFCPRGSDAAGLGHSDRGRRVQELFFAQICRERPGTGDDRGQSVRILQFSGAGESSGGLKVDWRERILRYEPSECTAAVDAGIHWSQRVFRPRGLR